MDSSWKIAVVVRDDLAVWQKLNVTAFVVSGIGTRFPELIGEDYVDGSGVGYLSKLGRPCLVFGADGPGIRRAFDRALDRNLAVSVYTEELFSTGNDVDNRAAVAAVPTDELVVVGFAVVGDGKQVDKALHKLSLHS